MTVGLDRLSADAALEKLSDMTAGSQPIAESEFRQRMSHLQQQMRDNGVAAMYLHAGTNLYYFTGLQWSASERMVAAIVPASGPLVYVSPRFEIDTLQDYWLIPAEILMWEEHESPYQLVAKYLSSLDLASRNDGGRVLIDEQTPYFIVSGLQHACDKWTFATAQPLTQHQRQCKSPAELALIQQAHQMTLAVLRSAASMLQPGISTTQVTEFLHKAHQKVGAKGGSYFAIALFGVATSFPHGVKNPQILRENDWVLLDTGCQLHGYISDITRSFCFGSASDRQRQVWGTERQAQLAAFGAAALGQPCEAPDYAARQVLEAAGFGPDYQLPGLPHRTGHGCGLNIHEGPYLVRGDKTPMTAGMVFSNEPMLVLPGEFGCRLEDHFYLTEQGPRWITTPAESLDNPFEI